MLSQADLSYLVHASALDLSSLVHIFQIYWSKEVPDNKRRKTEILGAGEQLRLEDGRLRMISSDRTPYSILVIEDVRSEDAGDYRCSLPTTNGTKNVHITLEVKGKTTPRICFNASWLNLFVPLNYTSP